MNPWGLFPDYQSIAKFEYGRMLWKNERTRRKLIENWTDPRHPHRERFEAMRPLIERVLGSDEPQDVLNQRLLAEGTSLRAVARDIPTTFGFLQAPAAGCPPEQHSGE